MSPWLLTGALAYAALALAHSWLGERKVIQPLLREPWQLGLPRRFADPLVRWAWHLTSIAWLGAAVTLAWAAAGGPVAAPVIDALGAVALASAVILWAALRGAHAAWAVFALGGFACLVGAHGWPSSAIARGGVGAVAALVLAGLAALHVYWAAGGQWGIAVALPTRPDGARALNPPAIATLAVAVALLATAAIVASAAGVLPRAPAVRGLGLAASAVFGVRLIGDFRFSGLFKRVRGTAFARWDSLLFSPLCGALCAACAIAAA